MFIFYTVFLLGKKNHIKIVEVSLLNCGKIVGFYIKDIKKNFMSPAHTCTVNRFSCRCFASHTRFSCGVCIWECAACVEWMLLETNIYVTVISNDVEWDSCSVP